MTKLHKTHQWIYFGPAEYSKVQSIVLFLIWRCDISVLTLAKIPLTCPPYKGISDTSTSIGPLTLPEYLTYTQIVLVVVIVSFPVIGQ